MVMTDGRIAPVTLTPVIRPVTEGDHVAIHEILTSPAVIEGTMRVPHAALHTTVTRLTPQTGVYHLVADVDGRAVGLAELITSPTEPRHRHVGELNLIATHPDWGRRGIGRSLMSAVLELADDWLHLHRLGLVVFVDNTHAIEMYAELGFAVEGTLRAYGSKRGRFVDAHVMARLRP